MKLRIIGMICPGCGGHGYRADRTRHRYYGWIGYAYPVTCSDCFESYLILYTNDSELITIISDSVPFTDGSRFISSAGTVETGDIPF